MFLIVNDTVCGGTTMFLDCSLFLGILFSALCFPFFLYNLSWSCLFVFSLTEVIILVKQSFMRIKSCELLTFCKIFLNNS